jgi:protocatechuate 3,4-dioxygenase beta subunit
MKRIVAIVVICVLAILGVIALRERASRSSATDDSAAHPVRGTRPRPDPAQLVRGSIAGTVADEEGRPVAGAHVCAEGR